MTRTMYDSVTPSNCPTGAPLYGAYVDGRYANVAAMQNRNPNARIVKITVTGNTLNAHVADVENGDLSPTSGAAWAKRRLAAGYHPTLYCSASVWPAVKNAVAAAGIAGKVSYWIAHYDGDPTIPNGAVAKQYLGDFHGYDKSSVLGYWPGVDPAPSEPTFTYKRPLRKGMSGSDVTQLKARLKWLGYGGTVPGPIFGRGLDAAVRAFQKAHKLTVDGVVGPVTAQAINK